MNGTEYDESVVSKENREREAIKSSSIRCGRRTYFFDLKISQRDEVYLALTESKRHLNENGSASYEKHKIFVLKQDLKSFYHELGNVIEFIETNPQLIDLREYEDVNPENEE